MSTPDNPLIDAARGRDPRPAFEDGSWHWVEYPGWSLPSNPEIAPACYNSESDAWYSHRFSGISTRFLKVLEPCRRTPAAPQPLEARKPLTAERVREVMMEAGYEDFDCPDPERAAFISGLRHGEAAQGITGEPT